MPSYYYTVNRSIILFDQTYKGEISYMLNKKETALLVIDMQYGGGAPDGSLVKMLNVDVTKQVWTIR